MKKKKVIITGVTVFIIMAAGILGLGYRFFYSMSSLPQGEYMYQSTSPEGTYTIKAYLCNGGATTSFSVRGELIEDSKEDKGKNIYWDYKKDYAHIEWEDDDTVIINGHRIDLPRGKYDWRREN